jgi:hypothetical protein
VTELVEVIEEDILGGVPGDRFACPVALALNRKLGPSHSVGAGDIYRVVTAGRDRHLAPIPPTAATFIDDFDAGRPVAPFTFELEIPDVA